MGYIVKDTVTRLVRTDTLIQVRDKKTQADLEAKGLLLQKQGIGILVYSDTDLIAFYEKHTLRQSHGTYTVLVKNETDIPSLGEVRTLVETALRIGTRSKDGRIVTVIPQISETESYGTRIWLNQGVTHRFLDESAMDRAFNFREVIEAKSKKGIIDACKQVGLSTNDSATIVSIYEESFRKFPDGTPKVEYTVDYVWIISKIMIFKPGYRVE
ncbi:MAG TPA: hypothetical protein VJ044_00185 [Candidatus Hodarchaeales archaeon]|nr:hypothetical protein [Candidatus Hodarchaeales archaeon]